MKCWTCLALAGLLLVVALTAGACADPSPGAGVDRPAPSFQLESLDGHQVSLADYAGDVVLLNFWATWCPPCRLELPDIEKAYQDRRDEGLVVLGIDVGESPQVVRSFADEFGLTFPVLLDTSGQVAALYRERGLPMTLIVDRDGVIRVRHIGYLSASQLGRYLDRVLP